MADLLTRMAASSAARVAAAKLVEPLWAIKEKAFASPEPPRLAFHDSGFDLICEVKPRSPSEGALTDTPPTPAEVAERALGYADAGAAAISVLTEPDEFGGFLDHIRGAAQQCRTIPVMRKDFLVDPFQIYEARAAGAGGVLLITRLLDDARLRTMVDTAAECALFVLLEAFDADDCARAHQCAGDGHVLHGINSRDLATLAVRPETFEELHDALPAGVPRVAESGMRSPEDTARVAALGYDFALVGTALMRSDDPAALITTMLQAGRAAKESRP